MAREAGVERVVLTHLHPPADALDLTQEVGRGFEGEVLVAKDRLAFSV